MKDYKITWCLTILRTLREEAKINDVLLTWISLTFGRSELVQGLICKRSSQVTHGVDLPASKDTNSIWKLEVSVGVCRFFIGRGEKQNGIYIF
ncbi:hypothetical protein GCM10020219_054500 [Nonomuraea dietziae]